ncbi:class I SAM-dependent methyltransferase [Deinococcus sp.]|uniref:class I SAM-dependent methyltransferase n=1 Tax=Deinococcus sp. TaxID=47478 RepID=UPI0028699069|nr:class I SAM-dependent methyltransferase [Deinococcus sp.]
MIAPAAARPTPSHVARTALGGLTLAYLGLRVWVRLRPQPIPYGWAWLLENPWRRRYRDPQKLADACALRTTDTVLEAGCGSGLFTPALAARCAHLTVLDIEPRYLAQTAARTASLPNVTVMRGDLAALPVRDASVDVVVLVSVLTELPRPVDALRGCVRALRPGGRIVIGEELFAPEYVRAGTVDAWAQAAGLRRVGRQGTAWAYLHTYIPV